MEETLFPVNTRGQRPSLSSAPACRSHSWILDFVREVFSRWATSNCIIVGSTSNFAAASQWGPLCTRRPPFITFRYHFTYPSLSVRSSSLVSLFQWMSAVSPSLCPLLGGVLLVFSASPSSRLLERVLLHSPTHGLPPQPMTAVPIGWMKIK